MYIKLCDRCGRITKNGAAFLLPTTVNHGSYQVNGTWFGGEGTCLCNNCLEEFSNFMANHEVYNNLDILQQEKAKT